MQQFYNTDKINSELSAIRSDVQNISSEVHGTSDTLQVLGNILQEFTAPYSLAEQNTGVKWLNGKPIFRRVFRTAETWSLTNYPDGGGSAVGKPYWIDIGEHNIGEIIQSSILYRSWNGSPHPPALESCKEGYSLQGSVCVNQNDPTDVYAYEEDPTQSALFNNMDITAYQGQSSMGGVWGVSAPLYNTHIRLITAREYAVGTNYLTFVLHFTKRT